MKSGTHRARLTAHEGHSRSSRRPFLVEWVIGPDSILKGAIGRHPLPAEPAEGLAGREVDALHSQQLEWRSVRTSSASGISGSCIRQVAFETSLEIKVTSPFIATDKTANSRHAARCPEPRLSRIVPSRVGGNDGRDDRAICALLVPSLVWLKGNVFPTVAFMLICPVSISLTWRGESRRSLVPPPVPGQ